MGVQVRGRRGGVDRPLLAFVISFVALRDLTAAMGAPWLIPYLFPLLVAATASAATVALLVLDDAGVSRADSLSESSESPAASVESGDSLPAALPVPAVMVDADEDSPVTHASHAVT
ncbi:hypothetical protein ACXYTP_17360 [Tsukamurella ocularis]